MMSKPDPYAFETQSQHSLAYGVVEDMKGIRFPNLASDQYQQQQQQEQQQQQLLQTQDRQKQAKKKRPSRIDLSLLFPRPKPPAEPLLSPQRLTNSPSPVLSEASIARKAAPVKLTKPRSRSNSRKKVLDDVIPEESPAMPSQSRKTVDWFDIPVEKTIRVDRAASDYADDEEISPKMVFRPTPEVRQPQPQRAPSQKDTNFSQPMSIRSSRRSSLTSGTSRTSRGTSRSIESQVSPQPTTQPSDRIRTSLQPWQSQGDLRSNRSQGKLSKKSSSSTLRACDLSKTSVLSLSSSEDEDESEDAREDDAKYGESLVKGAAPPRMIRASISTYDGFEPEICTAEAVIPTRGQPLTQFNRTAPLPLHRSYSKMSTDSSDSRRTVRQRSNGRSRDSSLSSVTRSTSNRRLESRASTRVPLIEEQEELADVHEENEESSPNLLPVPANNSTQSAAKRRSRIIAVTRQEESFLEAMRQRNGRFTPSIFHEVTSTSTDSDTDSNSRVSPKPRVQEATQPSSDTSFLRLSTAMFPSPGSQSGGEGAVSKEKEAFMSLSSTSDSEQRTESNSTASPRLSLAYSETQSSSSTTGHTSPMTPTLSIHRFPPRAPPPSHAPPPIPDAARRHSRRRTDSSEAIVVDDSANGKDETEYPLWAIKWAPDSVDLAVAH
jgi:hypothetical protein